MSVFVIAYHLAILLTTSESGKSQEIQAHERAQMFLLLDPQVQRELGLTEPQRQTAIAITRSSTAKYREIQSNLAKALMKSKTPAETLEIAGKARPAVSACYTEWDTGIKGILDGGQRLRLRQIGLQVTGLAGFSDPEIIRQLRLNESQADRLRALSLEESREVGSLMRDEGKTGHKNPFSKEVMAVRDKFLTKAFAELNTEQRKEWRSLTGRPFRPSPNSTEVKKPSP